MNNFQFLRSTCWSQYFLALRSVALFNFQKERGFALLIAIIFMSVMLSFGLTLGSLGYKQQMLASGATASQYAFYAADAALECALYADQQRNLFAHAKYNPMANPSMDCSGSSSVVSTVLYNSSVWVTESRISLEGGSRCADVTIYKYTAPQAPSGMTSFLFSEGYNVPCTTVATPGEARFFSRGLTAHY